jgi:branched-subunit amino acid aminotransferase/4-amino-4-deoxychorismate lyase
VAGADTAGAGAGAPWPGGAARIDGRYRPVEEAKISVLDLGITRSDCTYDAMHVWDGRFFRLADHLDRFTASLARLRLDPVTTAPRSRPSCTDASATRGCARRTCR